MTFENAYPGDGEPAQRRKRRLQRSLTGAIIGGIAVAIAILGLMLFRSAAGSKVEETYYPSGKLSTRREQDGNRTVFTSWSENGKQIGQTTSVKGRVVQLVTWHPNGQKHEEWTLSDDSATGDVCKWWPNGKLMTQRHVFSGYVMGNDIGFYESGQKFWEMKWDRELDSSKAAFLPGSYLDGPMRIWHPNGQLLASIDWWHGHPRDEKYWSKDGTLFGSERDKLPTEVQALLNKVTVNMTGRNDTPEVDEKGWSVETRKRQDQPVKRPGR